MITIGAITTIIIITAGTTTITSSTIITGGITITAITTTIIITGAIIITTKGALKVQPVGHAACCTSALWHNALDYCLPINHVEG